VSITESRKEESRDQIGEKQNEGKLSVLVLCNPCESLYEKKAR
jgi:hypothetical protein